MTANYSPLSGSKLIPGVLAREFLRDYPAAVWRYCPVTGRRLMLAAVLAAGVTHAQPVTIGAHLVTAHSAPGYCNVNPGLYVRYADGLTLGAYRNSECRVSAYVGRTWAVGYGVDLTAGMITGYRNRAVGPLLVPSMAWTVAPGAALRLAYVPRWEKGGAHALHLSVERR